MSASVSTAADDRRMMEACEWVLRLQAGEPDERTTGEWLQWCQSDPSNHGAFESARALWHKFDGEQSSSNPVAIARDGTAPRRRSIVPIALAASLVLGVTVAVWLAFLRLDPAAYAQTFRTPTAAVSSQTLPDGSVVELGARSAVRVAFADGRRSIFVEDGEAFFDVAKDASRPFVVQVGEVQVMAIGTAFNVRKAEDRVVVTVKEGAVRVTGQNEGVSAAAESAGGQVHAGAGHQVTYSQRQHLLMMTKVEPATATAWQTGRLEFVNEPLESVIADLNRYSPRPIALGDASLEALIFTGTLRADAIDDWLRGIEEVFPVTVIDRAEAGIELVGRAPKN